MDGTNLELFGSELETKIKQASSQGEEAWLNIDVNNIGFYIWKVENFRIKPISIANYGTFYEGDSYIILCIQKDRNNKLEYIIHFWLGQKTTLDEMGTAAYKTVELDTFLHGKAIQIRETQNNESDLFRSHFTQGIIYKLGGVESGFKKVEAFDYNNFAPLLYRVHNNSYTQVPLIMSSVTEDDVFVLDNGLSVYIYMGKNSSHKERLLGEYAATNIQGSRKNCLVYEISNANNLFDNIILNQETQYCIEKLYKIQEIDNVTSVVEIQGPITYESFDTNDAYTFTVPHTTFVWIGKNSSFKEMLNAWRVAVRVADKTSSITLVKEGLEPEVFKMCL